MTRSFALLVLGLMGIGIGWSQEVSPDILQKTRQNLERRFAEIQKFLSEKKRPNHSYEIAEQFFTATKLLTGPLPQYPQETAHIFDRISLRLDVVEFFIEKAPLIPKLEMAADREKARRNVIAHLEKWEKTELAKLQILRAAKDRDGKDTQDVAELFVCMESFLKPLQTASHKAAAEELLATWPVSSRQLAFLAKGIEQMLKAKNLPMRPGVTKKQVAQDRLEEDKRSGCAEFMADDDRYAVCKLRGMPKATQRQQRPGFNFELSRDLGVALPQICQSSLGSPAWKNPPSVDIWQYADDLHEGFIYYAFISKFIGIDQLVNEKDPSLEKIGRAFITACQQDPSNNGMALIYKGAYPFGADSALQILFREYSPPQDAFGSDFLAQQKDLRLPQPFSIEAFFFDTAFVTLGKKINSLILPFNAWGAKVVQEHQTLFEADKVRLLEPEERELLAVLQNEFDFLRKFEAGLKSGMQQGKTNYQASADALKQALPVLYETDSKKKEWQNLQIGLVEIAHVYDTHIDDNIRRLNAEQRMATEYVFRAGDSIFAFFKTPGNMPPRLTLTFEITQLVLQEDGVTMREEPLGVLTRGPNIPERSEQRLITYAQDGEKHWIAYFSMPFGIIPIGTRIQGSEEILERGIWKNGYIVADIPGNYRGIIQVRDEETKQEAPPVTIQFAIVP